MEDAPWIKLDTRALAKSGAMIQERDGVKVAVSLSPYDVPEAVRSFKDEKLNRYVIEFKFIQDESWERKSEKEGTPIVLRIGKNSGRVYGIEFDVDKLFQKNVHVTRDVAALITSSLERLLLKAPRPSREGHYKVMQQAVDESESQLLDNLETIERHVAAG